MKEIIKKLFNELISIVIWILSIPVVLIAYIISKVIK